ncbi:MAG TPA: DUF397 domain-containing protein [Pseudonocardiaceae bacterium]|jgi:hypothetical protein|nr:DUF397 domain-containing protein [Pseudonocardiaceae bacterium]
MSTPDRNGIVWRTSSYTGSSGNCVEVGWCTSSYTGTSGNCVEVALADGTVLVRDTKDREGPVLAVPAAAWRAFLADIPR